MPSGLPPNFGTLSSRVATIIHELVEYFEIPAINELTTSFQVAWRDCSLAFSSTSRFLFITFRPLFILIALLSRYVYIVVEIIARHTVHHAYMMTKESLYQCKIGLIEFGKFQKSLSVFWICIELGFCALLLLGYLLRRFIKKRRYVERLRAWYATKKRNAQKKYNDLVRQISKTSMTLALLLPHILFVVTCILAECFVPSILRLLSNKTYATDLISLWHPVYKTVSLLSFKNKSGTNVEKKHAPTKDSKNANQSIKIQKSGTVADRWLNATSQDSVSRKELKTEVSKETSATKLSSKGNVANRWINATSSSNKNTFATTKKSDDAPPKSIKMDFDTQASLLLRYWVVYGFMFSLFRVCLLLPFIGAYLSQTMSSSIEEIVDTTSYFSPQRLMSLLIPSPLFFGDLKLMFFVWLRFLPTSNSNEIVSKKQGNILKSSPLQIMYSTLAPYALHLANSSYSINLKANSSLGFVSSKLVSILDLAVLVRLISESTKQTLITIATESTTLLPACVTLFMPSTFTAYGCIYTNAIIPSANSVNCEISINGKSRNRLLQGSPEYDQAKKDRIRYLKYWVVQSILLLLMDTFLYSFLAWVPLSTHMTLIVWIWLNLPFGGINLAYEFFEYELVSFGFLDSKEIKDYDVNKTLTVRLFKRISRSIPAANDSSEKEAKHTSKSFQSEVKSEPISRGENTNEIVSSETSENVSREDSNTIERKKDN